MFPFPTYGHVPGIPLYQAPLIAAPPSHSHSALPPPHSSSSTVTSSSTSSSSASSSSSSSNNPPVISTLPAAPKHSPPASASFEDLKAWFGSVQSYDLTANRKRIYSLGWNNTGTRLASGSLDGSLRIWDADRAINGLELRGHSGCIECLAWHPQNSDLIATIAADKTLRLWDIRVSSKAGSSVASSSIQSLTTSEGGLQVVWHPRADHLIFSTRDDQISLLDANSWQIRHSFRPSFEANELAYNADGDVLYVCTHDGHVELFRPQNKFEKIKGLAAHSVTCTCIDYSAAANRFVVGANDAVVSIWDAKDCICVATWTRLEYPIRSASMSFDGQLLACSSEDCVVDVCYLGPRPVAQLLHTFSVHAKAMNLVRWHPKQYVLACVGETGSSSSSSSSSSRSDDFSQIRLWGYHSSS